MCGWCDLAEVGVEIHMIRNDGGEKLNLLQGVISRLDRNAPEYEGYHDFNTSVESEANRSHIRRGQI